MSMITNPGHSVQMRFYHFVVMQQPRPVTRIVARLHLLRNCLAKTGRAAILTAVCIAGMALSKSPIQGQELTTLLTSGLPLWEPGHAITTGIKDALPIVTTLNGIEEDGARPIPDDWNLAPGYYRGVIRSYCLHAGTYGPTKGDGYLIAPLKGDRAALIRNILLRSQQNPKIEQSDVQRLIWGTEDGAQWDSYDNEFKIRAAALLTPEEIILLNVEPKRAEIANEVKKRLGGLIPGKARQLVDTYGDLRNKITSTTSYDVLERIAVKTGAAPWGKDSRKDVQPGAWAYVGDGFYIRAYPESYPTTTLEIYRVASAKIKRDDKNRIVRFDSDGYVIETTYSNEPATILINGNNERVWNFKSVTFRHPDGRVKTIENKGYIIAEPIKEARLRRPRFTAFCDDGGLDDMGHYKNGLKTAVDPTDLKGQLKWIDDHLGRVGAAWNAAKNALAGQNTDDARPKKFDPTHFTATPANTSKQRLALSAYSK